MRGSPLYLILLCLRRQDAIEPELIVFSLVVHQALGNITWDLEVEPIFTAIYQNIGACSFVWFYPKEYINVRVHRSGFAHLAPLVDTPRLGSL